MSQELTLNLSLAFAKGNVSESLVPGEKKPSVSGDAAIKHLQNIDTSAEAIETGDLGTLGYMLAWNQDDTNYVEIGDYVAERDPTFVPLCELKAGEVACFRVTQNINALYAQANTEAVDLYYILVEA